MSQHDASAVPNPDAVARTPLADAPAAGETALLVIDMFSSWDFPGGDVLRPAARRIAPRIAALRQRCREAGVPTLYVNDNQGRWRSDFRDIVGQARAAGGDAAAIAEALAPASDDYVVLKVKHSGFHATPLDLLLRHLAVRHLILTGTTAEQCVLMTAADAHSHDYELAVPPDCMAGMSREREQLALRQLADVLGARTTRSPDLPLPLGDGT